MVTDIVVAPGFQGLTSAEPGKGIDPFASGAARQDSAPRSIRRV